MEACELLCPSLAWRGNEVLKRQIDKCVVGDSDQEGYGCECSGEGDLFSFRVGVGQKGGDCCHESDAQCEPAELVVERKANSCQLIAYE